VNIPNLISLARLLAVPVVLYLILEGAYAAAFWLFVAAGASDAIDGYLAKRLGQSSRIGALLDPLADKALLVGVYIVLGMRGEIPEWLVFLVVSRDFLIVGGGLLALIAQSDYRARPLMVSKVNTALQILLAAVALGALALDFDVTPVRTWLVYLVAASTVLSGGSYLVAWASETSRAEDAG
jgi:cardiolipin synthase